MFRSHTNQEEVFQFFISFLNHAIDGKSTYKSIVRPIIEEAHFLASGEKDIYSVDTDNFPVITNLAESNPEFFKALDLDHIRFEDYLKILAIAKHQSEPSLFW